LATENASLRLRFESLENEVEEKRRQLASFDEMKLQNANLQIQQADAARYSAECKNLREQLLQLQNVHAEALNLQSKISAVEAERAQAVEAAAVAAQEAETFKNLHRDISLRLAETDVGETEKLKLQIEKLRIEKEQSEKARAQLAGTLKTVREESAARKDVPVSNDLVKLKDKRISELEEQVAKTVAPPEWGQMLAVVQEYKAALSKLIEKRPMEE
jgi:hypothetical protein